MFLVPDPRPLAKLVILPEAVPIPVDNGTSIFSASPDLHLETRIVPDTRKVSVGRGAGDFVVPSRFAAVVAEIDGVEEDGFIKVDVCGVVLSW